MAPFLLGSSGYIVGGLAAMLLRLNKEQVQGRHGFDTTYSGFGTFWKIFPYRQRDRALGYRIRFRLCRHMPTIELLVLCLTKLFLLQVIALSLETAMQNVGIPILILQVQPHVKQ